MLISVFAFGILAQTEAFQISSNNTDVADGPSPVSTLRVEAEETTFYTSYPPREDEDPMLNITSTLHPDIHNSSYNVSYVLLTETNATVFPKTNNSLFNETNTSLLHPSNATVFPKGTFTVSPEISYAKFLEINTTVFPKVTISPTPEVRTENPLSKCPNIGGSQVAGSVVKCHCQGNKIYVNGKCQDYDGVLVIPVEGDTIYTIEENVMTYNLKVKDINCDTSKHSYMEFTKNQFHLRHQGDIVLLKEAGELQRQRINEYCISHHLDKHGNLTCTMKACVPIPSVPRCCPPGKAMKKGKCEVANTPDVLKPPISAKPFSDSINWDIITEYHSPVKCDTESKLLITNPLGEKKSHLVSFADGVINVWTPGDIGFFYNCPYYCVDGINNSAGSVDYFTSFCYSDPTETDEKFCAKEPCLRKCCKYGYSIDKNRYSCVQDPNSTFTPSTDADLSNHNIVIGWPLCRPVSKVEEKVIVDKMGSLILKDSEFSSTEYCVDTFLDNDQRHESALACLTETSLLLEVRPYLIPICNFISLFFLMITIVSHLLVPRLLENGGLHQLCLLIGLFIVYITKFFVNLYLNRVITIVCFDLVIAMQFGFLTTFSWLNVMCFEKWRKLRRLRNFLPSKSYPNIYYMMYGWGIPFCICMITILMQKYVPENVWGVITPKIKDFGCWFRELRCSLVYFYCPIAILYFLNPVLLVRTYMDYKTMPQNYKETTNDLKALGAGAIGDQSNMSSRLPPREIIDHVHEFNQILKIYLLLSVWNFIIWITKQYLLLVNAYEEWTLVLITEVPSSLEGLFIFIILLSNKNKRKHLEEKYPKLFGWIKKSNCLPANMKMWLQNIVNRTLSLMSSLTSSISSQFSNSTITRKLTTSIQPPNPSSSSSEVKSSVSFDISNERIVVHSNWALQRSDSTHRPADPSLQSSKSPEVTPDSS